MRRLVLLLAVGSIMGAGAAEAKFGLSKTRLSLTRRRPPQLPILGETVAFEVRTESPEPTDRHLSLLRARLEEAVGASGQHRVATPPRAAETVVRVTVDELRADLRDEVRTGSRGGRTWSEPWRRAEGSLHAVLEAVGQSQPGREAGASYYQEFRIGRDVPPEASSPESLRRFLVEAAAREAAAALLYATEPVEILLAVDGELKAGNDLAQAGRFEEALQEWSRLRLQGEKEAARLHNLGAAHEALAYRLPPDAAEHRSRLEQAREHYLRARALDPGEKHFRDPPERVAVSLAYAGSAAALAADRARRRP